MKWMILWAALCLGSLLPGQGTWTQTQFEVPPVYDSNQHNYHHGGGFDKLDFHIADQKFNSEGSIYDCGAFGCGGQLKKSVSLSSAIAWTFKPDTLAGTLDPPTPPQVGQGVAQKTNGWGRVWLSMTLHDGPSEGALHGKVKHILKLDGNADAPDVFGGPLSGATAAAQVGTVQFQYGDLTVSIPMTANRGESETPFEFLHFGAIPQGPKTDANHVVQVFESQHGIYLFADANWGTAKVSEKSDGWIWCTVVLSSKWVVQPQ